MQTAKRNERESTNCSCWALRLQRIDGVGSHDLSLPDLSVVQALEYADVGICVIFLADFVVQFFTAKSKLAYMRWGWIDLLSKHTNGRSIRWGRVSRVVRILRLLRGVKSARMIFNLHR